MALVVVVLAVGALVVGDALLLAHRVPVVAVSAPGSGEGTSYLLLASDSRERLTAADRARYRDRNQPSGERADLVLVLRVPAAGRPTVYSLPRDLYVGQQRDRPHRLGLALQDGPQAIVDSLCTDVGVGVDHVLIADMDALVGLVDTSGPVTVRTTGPVRDRQAALSLDKAGLHRLDGREALAWVRSRHPEVFVAGRWVPDASSDPTRTRNAVEVLTQVRAHLDDPVSVQRAAWESGPRLRRDSGLGVAELLRLGDALSSATTANRLVAVPARLSGTEVPFAFVTPETEQVLGPLRSQRCPAPG
jgi:LCP family protein required for cell wall assembly